MEVTTYYGMDKNPFIKDADTQTLYQSNDFKQMHNRISFAIKTRGIGVFLSSPGMGKTTCLRTVLESLNPNRYRVIYLCLSNATPIDFYRMLNDELGLEETSKKSKMFSQIKDELKRLVVEKKMEIIIAIDESQFLRQEVIKELIMLMNFEYDSKDYCTLLLIGQKEFIKTLNIKALEAFRQRVNMKYVFTGFDEQEVKEYIESRLKAVNCRTDLFTEESYHTLYGLMNMSLRVLNNIINKSLIVGMNKKVENINSDIIREANLEVTFG